MTDAPEETPTAASATVLTGAEAPALDAPAPGAPAEVGAPEAGGPGERHLVEQASEHRRPVPEGGEHGAHPTDAQYIKIALILAMITGVEVAVYYIKGNLGDGFAPFLLALAAVKFFMVGAFFMHLRFDNRVLRRLFVTGIILAIVVYVIVFLLLGVFSTSHGAHH